MIKIEDKRDCTGCGVCLNACAVGAIHIEEDDEGFTYPRVNLLNCVSCGKCISVCPMQINANPMPIENRRFTCKFYAGQLRDKDKLSMVSSGGAFYAFAQAVLNKDGVVYGVDFSDIDQPRHIRVDNKTEIYRISRSKYLQSDVGDCYSQVKQDLLNSKTVLFSGTGCQVAALNCFLGAEYDNLYTCEVVCHGVPSKLAWRSFRKEYEKKKGKEIESLVFRDKTQGWKKNSYKITFADGTFENVLSSEQAFHMGYLQGLFYRPSCGRCRFVGFPRIADITLADYWKYRGEFLDEERDLGISLIVANNHKGQLLLEASTEYLAVEESSKELSLNSCKRMTSPQNENVYRAAFLKELKKNGYYAAAKKYIVDPNKKRNLIHRGISKIRRMVRLR